MGTTAYCRLFRVLGTIRIAGQASKSQLLLPVDSFKRHMHSKSAAAKSATCPRAQQAHAAFVLVAVAQTPVEDELETGIQSYETRKYIFKSLDEIGTVCHLKLAPESRIAL